MSTLSVGMKTLRIFSSVSSYNALFFKKSGNLNSRTLCQYRSNVYPTLNFKSCARSFTLANILVCEDRWKGHAYKFMYNITHTTKRDFYSNVSYQLSQSDKIKENSQADSNQSDAKVQGTLGFLGLKESPKPIIDSSKPNDESSKDGWFSGKNAWKFGLGFLITSSIIMFGNLLYIYGSPKIDDDGNIIIDEFSTLPTWEAYLQRMRKELFLLKKMIEDPSRDKLLPDPLKEPYYQPPYTLVLEMTGVLVHPDWTLSTGWRFKKRPGLDYFLQQVGPPLFEVVIYTREQLFTAFPIINGIDPNGFISYRLFRDATRYRNGTHVKDLSCLNRDLEKIIIVDCDPAAYEDHFRNAVGLTKWSGDDTDTKLVDLANFLRTIGTSGVEDVRTVLDHYNQFDDPVEAFKENQIKLQMQQEEMRKMQQDNKSLVNRLSSGFLGRRR